MYPSPGCIAFKDMAGRDGEKVALRRADDGEGSYCNPLTDTPEGKHP